MAIACSCEQAPGGSRRSHEVTQGAPSPRRCRRRSRRNRAGQCPVARSQPIQLAATPAYRDTYRTNVVTDPFTVPIEQKLELLRTVAADALKVAGVFSVTGSIDVRLEDRFFVSSEGSVIEQHVYQISPEVMATAVLAGRKVKSRTYLPHSVCAGYEAVERANMLGHARRRSARRRFAWRP